MTKEDKQLLLKDMGARLLYGVKVEIYFEDSEIEEAIMGRNHPNPRELHPFNLNLPNEESPFIVKPYLRPMSSMTDKERKYYNALTVFVMEAEVSGYDCDIFDWLNEHHFDYRGLIEKGLALEAPEGMYE